MSLLGMVCDYMARLVITTDGLRLQQKFCDWKGWFVITRDRVVMTCERFVVARKRGVIIMEKVVISRERFVVATEGV